MNNMSNDHTSTVAVLPLEKGKFYDDLKKAITEIQELVNTQLKSEEGNKTLLGHLEDERAKVERLESFIDTLNAAHKVEIELHKRAIENQLDIHKQKLSTYEMEMVEVKRHMEALEAEMKVKAADHAAEIAMQMGAHKETLEEQTQIVKRENSDMIAKIKADHEAELTALHREIENLMKEVEKGRKTLHVNEKKNNGASNTMALSFPDYTCKECRSAENEESLLICDGCESGYHLRCLTPSLSDVPKGNWYCPNCKRTKKCQKNDESPCVTPIPRECSAGRRMTDANAPDAGRNSPTVHEQAKKKRTKNGKMSISDADDEALYKAIAVKNKVWKWCSQQCALKYKMSVTKSDIKDNNLALAMSVPIFDNVISQLISEGKLILSSAQSRQRVPKYDINREAAMKTCEDIRENPPDTIKKKRKCMDESPTSVALPISLSQEMHEQVHEQIHEDEEFTSGSSSIAVPVVVPHGSEFIVNVNSSSAIEMEIVASDRDTSTENSMNCKHALGSVAGADDGMHLGMTVDEDELVPGAARLFSLVMDQAQRVSCETSCLPPFELRFENPLFVGLIAVTVTEVTGNMRVVINGEIGNEGNHLEKPVYNMEVQDNGVLVFGSMTWLATPINEAYFQRDDIEAERPLQFEVRMWETDDEHPSAFSNYAIPFGQVETFECVFHR